MSGIKIMPVAFLQEPAHCHVQYDDTVEIAKAMGLEK